MKKSSDTGAGRRKSSPKKPTGKTKAAKKPAPPDPSKPLKNARHEAFARDIVGGMSASDAYRAHYNTARYKAECVHVNASKMKAKVSLRIEWLTKDAIDETIMSVIERKRVLSQIGRGCLTDYQASLPDRANIIVYDKDSTNPRAVQEVTTRYEIAGEGDGKRDAAIQKIKLHNPIQAIDMLNKMDGVYPHLRIQVPANEKGKKATITFEITAGIL